VPHQPTRHSFARLTPTDAIHVVNHYLIDAAISLTEGRGPLIVNGAKKSRVNGVT
jgi:hypothetical protein